MIGAVSVGGLRYDRALDTRTDLAWKSTAAGFVIAEHGEKAVEKFLADAITAQDRPFGFGPACFGQLHRRLAFGGRPGEWQVPLKRLCIRVGHELGMFHHSMSKLHGMDVPAARFVGVKHAAEMFGCNKRRLHSILIDMGLLDERTKGRSVIRVAVDLEQLAPVLRDIASSLTLQEAGEFVGISGTCMGQLVDMGSVPVMYEYDRTDANRSLRHILDAHPYRAERAGERLGVQARPKDAS